MINVNFFFNFLKKNEINFFCGVPDSVLKASDSYFIKIKNKQNIINHNEGGAIATAIGYFLKTKKIAGVYLQNSGLGNIINPIVSIANRKVYSIPMLLIIGWRGSPLDKDKDEPQHDFQGKITTKLLSLMGIRYCYINTKNDLPKLKKLIIESKKKNKIIACLIRRKKLVSLDKNIVKIKKIKKKLVKRFEVLRHIAQEKSKKIKIFSSTGYTSRELYQLRKLDNFKKIDFYNVGGMGHTAAIALGYAIQSNDNVLCLDGDGSLIMHMGTLATNGLYAQKNFKHLIFNNCEHESVGGQMTAAKNLNFRFLSKSCGYKYYYCASSLKVFKQQFQKFLKSRGPSFFEVKITSGSTKGLIRPKNLKDLISNF